ncbi:MULTISPECIES: hypothetical protein [unclassified Microbacterium]|uniref:hypothetical protein n=1 Tax=unclassified Microbacterium TaxID=2609290 RepID=UPI001D66FE39|nr:MULTISPECIES: hypothetical protein [unclassified Microbacterium]CAH0190270.1 hypothetical protein SRABI121_02224 [Microbacterium sp. Bi121]HWK78192.1 hypothetical protein [Microbacterium sp.]
MSNPPIPPLPFPDDDRVAAEGVPEPGVDPATVDDDGERTIDPDIDDDQVDSAEADRLAAGAEPEEGAL